MSETLLTLLNTVLFISVVAGVARNLSPAAFGFYTLGVKNKICFALNMLINSASVIKEGRSNKEKW